MFVLLDIEWVENSQKFISPAQIAAMRVDAHWNTQAQFYSRIHPKDHSFCTWKHIAYTGGTAADFWHAPNLYCVLTSLQSWLRPDDQICVWNSDAKRVLRLIYQLIFKSMLSQRIIVLCDYLTPFLVKQGRSPSNAYTLCQSYGTSVLSPKHHAEIDVLTMQKALQVIEFPSSLLSTAPPVSPTRTSPQKAALPAPYQLDQKSNLLHKTGCSYIPFNAPLIRVRTLKGYFRKNAFNVCPHCMKEDLRAVIRARNQSILDHVSYQFVYSTNSNIFHQRSCHAILNTTGLIMGSVHYQPTADTGRRPCKLCNPAPENSPARHQKKKASTSHLVLERPLNAREQRALTRYQEARSERLATSNHFQSVTEKNDFYTLTQPRFAFFSGSGYQSFHQRNCPKLRELTDITGYSHYKDAVRTGHSPCKLCKPTAKLDIAFPIPITNQKREGESTKLLEQLCAEHGYPCETTDEYFCFSTPVGHWKIDFLSSPYIAYHINRIQTPDNKHYYHRQPRLFLSLQDTFEYIQRHDQALLTRSYSQAELSANMQNSNA